MPTIKSMIENFIEYEKGNRKYFDCLLCEKEYALIKQEELNRIIDKNITKTSNREQYGLQITDAITESINKAKGFKEKVACKEAYMNLIEYLKKNYGIEIKHDIKNELMLCTPEERRVYLLRETERENDTGERKGLSEIAEVLGCSRRTLEKDLKEMMEQGFKLLGQTIKVIEDGDTPLKLDSTPHPIILMQNISQIMVMLEGLRKVEIIEAFRPYAESSAVNIWNQLTEYAQNKIIDVIEKFENDDIPINWYLDLQRESNYHKKFLTELEQCSDNISSQLMYLLKNGKMFNVTIIDDEKEVFVPNCFVKKYHPNNRIVMIVSENRSFEICDDRIKEIDLS